MITDPERWAPGTRRPAPTTSPSTPRPARTRWRWPRTLRAAGRKAGLAIDRDTPVEPYLELLPYVDTVLIMTIKAGLRRQTFMPEMLTRCATCAAGHGQDLEVRIEVDGGIAGRHHRAGRRGGG
jgi:ribulose-phosphate 3-epimerase